VPSQQTDTSFFSLFLSEVDVAERLRQSSPFFYGPSLKKAPPSFPPFPDARNPYFFSNGSRDVAVNFPHFFPSRGDVRTPSPFFLPRAGEIFFWARAVFVQKLPLLCPKKMKYILNGCEVRSPFLSSRDPRLKNLFLSSRANCLRFLVPQGVAFSLVASPQNPQNLSFSPFSLEHVWRIPSKQIRFPIGFSFADSA